MTQVVFGEDDALKRTEDERLAEEARARGGRPRKLEPTTEVLNTVRGLASISATVAEAADVLGVAESTFYEFVSTYSAAREAWSAGYSNGNISLRRWQFDRARAGSDTMLIWLGKNRLGQSDRREVTTIRQSASEGAPRDQEEAAQQYADVAQLPPALRLIAEQKTVEIDLEAEDVTAEMPSDDAA